MTEKEAIILQAKREIVEKIKVGLWSATIRNSDDAIDVDKLTRELFS